MDQIIPTTRGKSFAIARPGDAKSPIGMRLNGLLEFPHRGLPKSHDAFAIACREQFPVGTERDIVNRKTEDRDRHQSGGLLVRHSIAGVHDSWKREGLRCAMKRGKTCC